MRNQCSLLVFLDVTTEIIGAKFMDTFVCNIRKNLYLCDLSMSFFLLWDILWLFAVLILWEDFPEIGSFCIIVQSWWIHHPAFFSTQLFGLFFFLHKMLSLLLSSSHFFYLKKTQNSFFSLAWSASLPLSLLLNLWLLVLTIFSSLKRLQVNTIFVTISYWKAMNLRM